LDIENCVQSRDGGGGCEVCYRRSDNWVLGVASIGSNRVLVCTASHLLVFAMDLCHVSPTG
jgi:hypothetical protein